jgi:hypothetical protein
VRCSTVSSERFDLLKTFFATYATALDAVSKELGYPGASPSRHAEFKARLDACPKGEEAYAQYETLGTEIWHYLFPTALGEPKPQRRTLDGTQRRDVLFRNERTTKFFARVADRFAADFIVVAFKNYSAPELRPSSPRRACHARPCWCPAGATDSVRLAGGHQLGSRTMAVPGGARQWRRASCVAIAPSHRHG